MPTIRYVCLSDLHLGADNSLLTAITPGSIEIDPSRPSSVLSHFVLCLRELLTQNQGPEKPILILNGDILEMALSDVNKAAMAFERFLELVFPPNGEALFQKDILYLPGNHDHHIWESARETEYLHTLGRLQPGAAIQAPTHTTRMFSPELVREPLFTSLLHVYPHLQDASVTVAYPNYALLSPDGQKCVIVSHGHYVEAIYSLMTTLNTMVFPDRKRPTIIGQVEAENFAWIDFLWSTLGRSGDVGQHMGLIYAKMQDNKQVGKLTANFLASWIAHHKGFRPLDVMEAAQLEMAMQYLFNTLRPLEKHRVEQVLSEDAVAGLQWFVQDVVREQLLRENHSSIPAEISFLFGHTHKPFQQEMRFAGYPNPLKVYNSGGWVVDTVSISPLHGAAVLLLDDALDIVSLRMYNQAVKRQDYGVRVEDHTSPGMAHSAFFHQINASVRNAYDPWKSFAETAAQAVGDYARLLHTKINL